MSERSKRLTMAERFASDIGAHALTIIRDDGEYRHLRCQTPDSWIYGFDVVTWPGYLAYTGDMGDFMFTRVRDMFTFFRGDRPNPDYWNEKLVGPGPAHQAAMEFDCDAYRRYVVTYKLDVDDAWGEPWSISEAHRRLVDAGVDPTDLPSLERHSTRFLWACHAIPWAIARYDEAKEAQRVAA